MCINPNVSQSGAGKAALATLPTEKSPMVRGKPAPMNHVDYTHARREHLFRLPKAVEDWCVENLLRQKDARNLGIFLVGINILTTSVPLAASISYMEQNDILPKAQLIALGAFYAVFHLKTFARSFILALHYITHCSIFNLRFRAFDHVWKSGICNLFGIPIGLYYPHHIAMHHAEDNLAPFDMSSTMDYNRSSKWNHFKYMIRFFLFSSIELPYRLITRGKYGLALQSAMGYAAFFSTMIYTFTISPIASFFVFWFPWVACSLGLMQGNFKEHIFVDPDDYENNYKSAFTCINAPSNALTFNTGYHIEHHEEPGLPWYKYPDLFLKNLDKHAANDSFVFSGIGSMEVGTLVLFGKFDELADHYLNVGQPKRSKEELITEFKRRLTPIYHQPVKSVKSE